jgi:hypothetical protein
VTNMQTRASLIRAELRATAGANGQGTRLELVLPAGAEHTPPIEEAAE